MSLVARLFLRGLGLVYLIAFLSLEWQVEGLLGADGLRPVSAFLERARQAFGGVDLVRLPTVFWLLESDAAMRAACWVGAAAALLLIGGTLPLASLIVLFCLYLSFVNVGAPFLNYQWDALLLETGFLAIFWAPATARMASPNAGQPSLVITWCLRWLVFRLLFFSGWVKLASGDPVWWDLSALEYHYETQPLPTWTAWYAHQLPAWLQKTSVAGTFVVELVFPFFLVAGRRLRAVAATGFVALQILIGATGNYGFFNLLSVVLCLPLLDDAQVFRLVPGRFRARIATSIQPAGIGRTAVSSLAAILVLTLTVPATITQLTGVRDGLASAFDSIARAARPFHLASRYGLFAVMTRTRPEVILEGSEDGVTWTPYVFRWKPGPLDRRPVFVEPDMPRLDWQMWFDGLHIERAVQSGQRAHGVVTPSVLEKLREGSPAVLGLLGPDPFAGHPPRHLRWSLYDYRFTDPTERSTDGAWWKRRPVYTSPAS